MNWKKLFSCSKAKDDNDNIGQRTSSITCYRDTGKMTVVWKGYLL